MTEFFIILMVAASSQMLAKDQINPTIWFTRNTSFSYSQNSDTRMGIDLIAHNLSKRVLVVLDNVNNLRQIHALVGDRTCFGSGSKIIITTRHVQLLEVFGVDQFILAQGRPLPENVGATWEPYQQSRCVVAGLKEYIETFNQQREERVRYLQAVLLQERQKNAIQERLISELLEARGEVSASIACTMTKETVRDENSCRGRVGSLHLKQTMKDGSGGKAEVYRHGPY